MKKFLLNLSALLLICGCGGGSKPISLSLSPSAQNNIDAGQALTITATVANDPSASGVTWSMSGTSCSGAACGTLSNESDTSATYNAPATVTTNMTVTITATSKKDSTKSSSVSVVVAPTLTITTTSLAGGTVGTAYSATLQASGGAGTLKWSLASGSSLPAGLALSSAGVISGNPTAAGATTFTVKVADSSGAQAGAMSATQQLTLTIKPLPLTITTTALSNGVVGTAYSATVAATGGTGTITWSVTTGSLPAGLSLSGSTISGTPTTAGATTFTLTATDSGTPQQTAKQSLSITINPKLAITTTSAPNGTIGTAYSVSLVSSGGVGTISWTVISGSLPAGLTLSTAGAISGTPTTAGNSSFTVQAKDSGTPQQTVQQALSIAIYAGLTITTASLPNGTVNSAYSATLASAGGTGTVTWSLAAGSLPAGLSLNGATISGTPTTAGTSSFTVSATDTSTPPQTKTQALTLTISPPLSITTTSLPAGSLGTAYTENIQTGGGTLPIAWSVTSGSLPAGLALAGNSTGVGVISGTPTAAGSFTFTVTAKDSSTPAVSVSQQFTLVISAPPLTITTTTLLNGTVGTAYSAPLQASGGTSPYSWTVASGSLPTGLTVSGSGTSWKLSGTPTVQGTSSFTLQVADSGSPQQTKTQAFSVTISTNATLAITTTVLPSATAGFAYNQFIQTNGGGKLPITWTISSGSLPPGLQLQSVAGLGYGVITGTPTQTENDYSFSVTATDSSSPAETATAQLSIQTMVPTLYINTVTLPNGSIGTPYSAPLIATGGTPPYKWTVSNGSLPAWASLSGSGTSWTISGTPTANATTSFSLTVTDSGTYVETASATYSMAVAAPQACGSGNESAMKGQYAFMLSGYSYPNAFMGVAGSFTADGSGHITAGTVDATGAPNSSNGNMLNIQSGSILAASSSYSLGKDNRGCATITTPFYTFTTRFAISPTPSGAAQGTIEEWEASQYGYIAAGQIFQQSVPTKVPDGVWVFRESGYYIGRAILVGTRTLSGGNIVDGEYDRANGNQIVTVTGASGNYGTPDPTTGRLTLATLMPALGEEQNYSTTLNRVVYQVSSTKQIEITAQDQSVGSAYSMVGYAQLQSTPITFSGKMVYFGTGAINFSQVTYAAITASGGTFTGNDWEVSDGFWFNGDTPGNPTCAYAIDSYGRVGTSGTNCGTYMYEVPWSRPPVFYLTSANTGFMIAGDQGNQTLGEAGVLLGNVFPQTATTITAGTYYFGTADVVTETGSLIATASVAANGTVSGTEDLVSWSNSLQGNLAFSPTWTLNADGTFTSSDIPSVVTGIVVSGSTLIKIDTTSTVYPTMLVINIVPGS